MGRLENDQARYASMPKRKQRYELETEIKTEIDTLRPYDLPDIARLYEEAFSEHFLGHMGQRFLRLFCAQFINSPSNYGFVAKCNGRPVGFVFGTLDDDPFNQFYHQHFITLALIVVQRYIADAYVRKHISKRLGHILVAIKTLLPFHKRTIEAEQANSFIPVRILALGVGLNYRGMGIANKLTSHYCAQMRREGFRKVGLSVLPWNERAIRFYKKDSWIQEDSSETSLSFIRIIKPASP